MNDAAANLTHLFLALADKTRLRILNLLAAQEISVLTFVSVLHEPQPKISRHLAYLRDAKLVETRRDGKLIYYRLTMPANNFANHILGEVLTKLVDDEQMRSDIEKLKQIAVCSSSAEQKVEANAFVEANALPEKRELAVFLL